MSDTYHITKSLNVCLRLFALGGLATWTYSHGQWRFPAWRWRQKRTSRKNPAWDSGTDQDGLKDYHWILEYFKFRQTHMGMGHTYPLNWAVLSLKRKYEGTVNDDWSFWASLHVVGTQHCQAAFRSMLIVFLSNFFSFANLICILYVCKNKWQHSDSASALCDNMWQ